MTTWRRPEGGKDKVLWHGKVISAQPRIRLMRSFDQRTHGYQGYTLTIEGVIGGEERTFKVGIGKGAQAKHQFKAGDVASGRSEAVQDPRSEVVEYYKTSELKAVAGRMEPQGSPPPW